MGPSRSKCSGDAEAHCEGYLGAASGVGRAYIHSILRKYLLCKGMYTYLIIDDLAHDPLF